MLIQTTRYFTDRATKTSTKTMGSTDNATQNYATKPG